MILLVIMGWDGWKEMGIQYCPWVDLVEGETRGEVQVGSPLIVNCVIVINVSKWLVIVGQECPQLVQKPQFGPRDLMSPNSFPRLEPK